MPTKAQILELADYLTCNGEELWSELEPMFKKAIEEAVEDALWHERIGQE